MQLFRHGVPAIDSCQSQVCDPEGIKARSRWLSESASDTTGILNKSVCIPEGCQRAATPAGVGVLDDKEPVVSARWPQPPATCWQASGLLSPDFSKVSAKAFPP